MNRVFAAVFTGFCLTPPAVAQELLGGYFALIGPEDMRNSSGAALGNICAIVQQDRANYHKFGIRQEYDEGDPWFATPAARQKISQNCRIAPGSEYIPLAILRGETRYIRVQVFGSGGVPQYVVVHEGAG